MIKLKHVILEGKYDKLTGEIIKAIFNKMKSALREDPLQNQEEIYVGAFSDVVSDVEVEIELIFTVSKNIVKKGSFSIDGSSTGEDGSPIIEIIITIHPKDGEQIFSKIQPELRDIIRHEIEHLTHSKDSDALKVSKALRGDTSARAQIASNPEKYYKYFLLPKEVDANIHGLYSKAKTIKQPYQKVVDDYLNSLVDSGVILPKHREMIYAKWKKRIPTIGGLPNLR